MPRAPHHRWFQVEPVSQVALVTFTVPDILDLEMIRLMGEQLFTLVGEGRRIVLNFHHVDRLSTALVGKIIALHHRLKDEGGQLALCRVSPQLRQALELLKLPKLLPIYSEEREALEALERTTSR
jgi:anti-anti-sigma factor